MTDSVLEQDSVIPKEEKDETEEAQAGKLKKNYSNHYSIDFEQSKDGLLLPSDSNISRTESAHQNVICLNSSVEI